MMEVGDILKTNTHFKGKGKAWGILCLGMVDVDVDVCASFLSDDYKKAFNIGIKTKSDNEPVATVAQDRVQWKSVVAKVTDVSCELRGEKITERREARISEEASQREYKLGSL